jgi:hypothetical protein
MVEWKTISSKVSEDVYGAMKIICERENIKPNEFIRRAVEKTVSPVLNKEHNSTTFPGIGENKFEYEPEADSFMWTINFGSGNSALISGKLSPFFVENILNAIKVGLDRRSILLKKLKKNKTYVPEAIIKFRES